jgi:hypothetical protein
MEDERGTKLVYDDGDVPVDHMATARILLVADVSGHQKRSKDVLQEELKEVPVNTVGDLANAFHVAITGRYIGLDNNARQVSIPVLDESTFTPTGMTMGDPLLYEMYIEQRTCENIASLSGVEGEQRLTAAQLAKLNDDIDLLQRATED